jgi:hypothetical protein
VGEHTVRCNGGFVVAGGGGNQNPNSLEWVRIGTGVPDVTQTDPQGVDFGWVMQVTFIVTILLGVPIVAAASLVVGPMESWAERVSFALRAGALVWFLTALLTYSYARMEQTGS